MDLFGLKDRDSLPDPNTLSKSKDDSDNKSIIKGSCTKSKRSKRKRQRSKNDNR